MSSMQRAKQWATFARIWHIYDAKWQNPFDSSKTIAKYLKGQHKPIYHPLSDCGDHVVVINCRDIALPGPEWYQRVFFHHTGYPKGGATWTLAWELHEKNPTKIMERAVHRAVGGTLLRKGLMARLHLFPDEHVSEDLLRHVTSQIPQLRVQPRRLDSYSEEEVRDFPKVFDYPADHVIR
ncbi:39S ribosomal protein L13, mitochondrial [Amphibalanus amphitrite]|uniref:39S ribosomal protein L13, mitochondrial n=1 Tax=Amphibalanus amphitrite TaxID=1232801 RepID=A0A6A4VCK6_AMPAM|nr:39S ribosomal protein L13, mitochondrial-like [Amphibalanus amphitrite]KAF0294077.1 39S ribosomal protein L13, mitochondrial [Amphibalanus amphitrite]